MVSTVIFPELLLLLLLLLLFAEQFCQKAESSACSKCSQTFLQNTSILFYKKPVYKKPDTGFHNR